MTMLLLHRFLILFVLLVTVATASSSAVGCYDSAQALQQAINALPLGHSTKNKKTVELLLCPSMVIEVSQPIQIQDRSVRIGCAVTANSSSEEDDGDEEPMCTLRSNQEKETRLIEITSTSTGSLSRRGSTPTVQLSQIRLENGESYDSTVTVEGAGEEIGSGGAVLSKGVNLIMEDCRLINNVASQKGGALSVTDNGKPILLLITRTIFQENLSIEQEDCHSIYFHQDHPATMVELNTENDFHPTLTASAVRQLGGSTTGGTTVDYWDDPAKATQALNSYTPSPGATLCF